MTNVAKQVQDIIEKENPTDLQYAAACIYLAAEHNALDKEADFLSPENREIREQFHRDFTACTAIMKLSLWDKKRRETA